MKRTSILFAGLMASAGLIIGGNASAIAKEAHATGKSVYDLVLSRGLLSRTELERILRPENLTRPGTLATRTRGNKREG